MLPMRPQSQYPTRSQRPAGPHPFFQPPRHMYDQQHNSSKSNLLSMFKTPEGNLDLEKITGTVEQLNKLYGQVSPMISQFIKK